MKSASESVSASWTPTRTRSPGPIAETSRPSTCDPPRREKQFKSGLVSTKIPSKLRRAVSGRGRSPRRWPRGRAAPRPSSSIFLCVRHAKWQPSYAVRPLAGGIDTARRERRRLWWGTGGEFLCKADASVMGRHCCYGIL